MRIFLSSLLLCFATTHVSLAADQQPAAFKVQLSWEAKGPNGESSSGSAVGEYAPASTWSGHIGANERLANGSGYDKTSPATFFQQLGGMAALRPGDSVQLVQSSYAGTGKTEKGCTFTSNDAGSGNVASIERDEKGALLNFCAACLEPGDVMDKCAYTPFFVLEFPVKTQEALEKFGQFKLNEQELKNFKSVSKTNEVVLETEPAEWRIKVKATLTGQ